jgi:hypothetical protein
MMQLSLKELKERTEAERRKSVIAVRARHLLVETEPLCDSLFEELKKGAEFHTLAQSISACATTREAGGDVGWVGVQDEFLDDVVPVDVRKAALQHKPGDVIKVNQLVVLSYAVCRWVGWLILFKWRRRLVPLISHAHAHTHIPHASTCTHRWRASGGSTW